MSLGRKQRIDNSAWLEAVATIEEAVSRAELDELTAATVADIKAVTAGKCAAYAWSAGKDSIVLGKLCEAAGVTDSMIGVCDLEYPAFAAWIEEHKPAGCEVINTHQDIDWLVKHQEMLFPKDSAAAGRWFSIVQHRAQREYFKAHELDVIILGRRRADGNYVGRNSNIYTDGKGVTRFSPLAAWKHEHILAYTLRLHIVEADRACTPSEYGGGVTIGGFVEGKIPEGKPGAGHKVYDGVEVDGNGRVVAYHISNTYPHQITSEPQKWQRVEAYGAKTGLPNILHIMDSERPDQYRGVPYLAQVIEPLLQLRRYTESELMAALVQSFFTAWIETETDPSDTPFNEVGAGDIAGVPAEVNADGGPMANNISDDDNEYEMGPGTVTHLAPGEKVNFGNPNIPTAGFETFVKTLCKLVGAALELPYDVLIKEFNSSYSASRGALLEAWEAFKMRRKWFVDDFCQPVYEMFLAEAVALGRINAPGFFTDPLVREAWCGARWIGPVQGSLDPKKEAEAALMLIDNAIKTHEQVSREMSGGDWEENVEQLQRENELLTQAGGNKVTVVSASPKEGDGDED